MSVARTMVLGRYPDHCIRHRFASELKVGIERHTGEPLSLDRAMNLAFQWEDLVEKTWKSFVSRKITGPGAAHKVIVKERRIYDHGHTAPDEFTKEEVRDFQELVRARGEELTEEDARDLLSKLMEYYRWMYNM